MLVFEPPGTATLHASVTTEGWVAVSYLWEVVSGSATLATPTALNTGVTFDGGPGTYLFKFTASTELHGTFLETLGGDYFVTEDDLYFAVQGAGGEGFSDPVSASELLSVTVIPAVAGSLTPTELNGADLHVLINGVEYAVGSVVDGIGVGIEVNSINESENSDPNVASLSIRGFTIVDGDEIVISLDSERIFGGWVMRGSGEIEELWEIRSDTVTVNDYSWRLRNRRVTKSYADKDISVIATELMTLVPGFSVGSIQSGLGRVSITFRSDDIATALNDLCGKVPGLRWKVDYFKRLYIGHIITYQPPPDPITTVNPYKINDFRLNYELSQLRSKVRVYGPSVNVALDTHRQATNILIDDGEPFGPSREGGNVLVSGIEDPDHIDIPDSFETSFAAVVNQPKLIVSVEPISDPNPTAVDQATACLNRDNGDFLRQLLLQVEWRQIRIFGDGLPMGDYTYYMTYVTSAGETSWKQQINTAIGTTGAGWFALGVFEPFDYNAIEFVAVAIPPSVSRVNIYRDVAGEKRLVGSLVGRGILGELGTHTGELGVGTSSPFVGIIDVGTVISPSSNTLVDTKSDAVFAAEDAALEMPDADSAIPHCPPDDTQDLDDPANLPAEPETIWYLASIALSYPVKRGASITRFVDVVDTTTQSAIAAKLGDDGIVEDQPLTGDYKSVTEMQQAGAAQLRKRNQIGKGISWTSFDRKTHPLLIVAVNVVPHVTGEFLIKTVNITRFEKVSCANGMKSLPLYSVTAEPHYTSLAELL